MIKKLSLLLLTTFLLLDANAQVVEMNFMGKIWHLHGIDTRVRFLHARQGYFVNILQNANFPSDNYREIYQSPFKHEYYANYAGEYQIPTFGIGLVMRPFSHAQYSFFRQLEFVHNLDISYLESKVYLTRRSSPFSAEEHDTYIRLLNLGYNPQFLVSTPNWGGIKFYGIGELLFAAPLRAYVYTNPPAGIVLNGRGQEYDRREQKYSDRISASYLDLGAGFGLGIKYYLSCRWNFHIEAKYGRQVTYSPKNNNTHYGSYFGLQMGMRYKFGYFEDDEEEEDTSADPPPVFW